MPVMFNNRNVFDNRNVFNNRLHHAPFFLIFCGWCLQVLRCRCRCRLTGCRGWSVPWHHLSSSSFLWMRCWCRCRQVSGVGCRAGDVVDVRPLQHTSVGLISLLYMQRTYTYVVGVWVHQIVNFCDQGGLHVPRPTSTGVVDFGAAAVFVRI